MSGRARYFVLFMFFIAVLAAPSSGAEPMTSDRMTPDHRPWGELLQAHVVAPPPADRGATPHFVDYAGLEAGKPGRVALGAYIESLEAVDPATLSRDDQFAFWVNLYNALTVRVVADHYPVASIRDISISPGLFSRGPWGKKLVRVAGRELSLDDIEHVILRPEFGDPRVHYAVNCASWSCPDLALEPYEGATLDAQLDAAARRYVNSPRGVEFRDGRLTASSIFSWYKKDFGGTDAELIAHLRKYAEPELAAALAKVTRVSSYDYDWSLNDAARLEETE
ncbi:MAG: DUF547 domain-containing protein [Alphaproteobacteria bacterium HGW-Alphaproteobacteria-11]|nr:MAG: DUF547 domain-containing protein [Alphaproteobacteria bacterium HGW-Alphaproteobacteria-11]